MCVINNRTTCTANKHVHCRFFPAVGTRDQRSLSSPGLASSRFPTGRNPKRSVVIPWWPPRRPFIPCPSLRWRPLFTGDPMEFRERDSSPSSREQHTMRLSQPTSVTGLQALSQVLCRECWDKPLSSLSAPQEGKLYQSALVTNQSIKTSLSKKMVSPS